MIQIKQIVKHYLSGDNKVEALRGVDINFRNSEFVSILGPSGCGKTTLLNIIGGLDKYTSGDIVINGVSTVHFKQKDWDSYRNHYIGFVFQSYNLIQHLSVLQNVELALTVAGLSKKEKRKKALKALKEVGLESQIKKKPYQLSGGQMQRVAIARAIVNEPKIILADEPTGALDSETSKQVMEILKKMSSKYLIIMVTHNQHIANKYSTRTIELFDGNVVKDSNQFCPSEDEIAKDKQEYQVKQAKNQKTIKRHKRRVNMSFWSASALSFKNLWSKKGKTFLTSFAGSIGIIGIALVLAVSAGFNRYLSEIQTNTLGASPINISMISVDYNALLGGGGFSQNNKTHNSGDGLGVYNSQSALANLGYFNYLSDDFVEYFDNYFESDSQKGDGLQNIKSFQYDYGLPINLLTKNNGIVTSVKNSDALSALSGTSRSNIYEIIDNKDWILSNYELTGSFASNSDELMLVVGGQNRMSISALANFGIGYTFEMQDGQAVYDEVKYQDIIANCEYVMIFNNSLYGGENFEKINFPVNTPTNSTITNLYGLGQSLEQFDVETSSLLRLKISGVLRPKANSNVDILKSGLVYTSALRTLYNENSQNSDIVKYAESMIAENVSNGVTGDAIYNIRLPWTYSMEISELRNFGYPPFAFNSTGSYIDEFDIEREGMVDYIRNRMQKDISYQDAFNIALQQVGVANTPKSIYIYPTSFDAKKAIIAYISAWNDNDAHASNQIMYSDATEMLTNSMGQMVNIASYVLIAFAGISLVVSSIMIGIITYTSVVERTKEIGVLRSIGARKKDISSIFNSETIIIGLFAGMIGVFVSWLLTFPISSAIAKFAGDMVTDKMAILLPSDALMLMGISTVLTMVAGLIPAYIASKKDPVICLRSE